MDDVPLSSIITIVFEANVSPIASASSRFALDIAISQSCTLRLFNIGMENGPFIDDFPIKTSIYEGFSMAMLNNQMIYIHGTMIFSKLPSQRLGFPSNVLPNDSYPHNLGT